MTPYDETVGYWPRLLELALVLRRGVVTHAMISHDDWCPAIAGKGHCTCYPRHRGDGRRS